MYRHGFGCIPGQSTEVNIVSDAGLSRFCFSGSESSLSKSIVEVIAVLSLYMMEKATFYKQLRHQYKEKNGANSKIYSSVISNSKVHR